MANETGLDNLNKELANLSPQVVEATGQARREEGGRGRRSSRRRTSPYIESARRKMANARASLVPGSESITSTAST